MQLKATLLALVLIVLGSSQANAQATKKIWQYNPTPFGQTNDLVMLERAPGGQVPNATNCGAAYGVDNCQTLVTPFSSLFTAVPDGSISTPGFAFGNDQTSGALRDTSTGGMWFVYKNKQSFGMVPSPDTNTNGPAIFLFGNASGGCCNNDELTSVVLQHRGYGHGDTSVGMLILENSDATNPLAQGDSGYDAPGTGGPASGYPIAVTVGLGIGTVGKEPAVRVQTGAGVQAAFVTPSTPGQSISFDATGVNFSPGIPAATVTNVRQRDQMQVNSISSVNRNPYISQVTGITYDVNGNITRLSNNGWYSPGNGSAGQIPPASTGYPIVVATGHGYKVGDTVTMNTTDGQHLAVFVITMLFDNTNVAPSGGALGEVMTANLQSIIGSGFATNNGNFTQLSTSGSGTGLVLNLNTAVWVDTINSAFARNTTCALQPYYQQDYFADNCSGEEMDMVNDYGDIHHYDGSGNATDALLSINPAQNFPYLVTGYTVQSLGGNAINYAYAAIGDMEAGFISDGARQAGFLYAPTGKLQLFNNAAGFISRQLGGPAFVSWPCAGATPAAGCVFSFSVQAATGEISTAGQIDFGITTNGLARSGTIRGVYPGTNINTGILQMIAGQVQIFDPTAAYSLSVYPTASQIGFNTSGSVPAVFNSLVVGSIQNLSFAGTTQGTATPMTAQVGYVTGGTGGAILNNEPNGSVVTIINQTGSAGNIYPPSGSAIYPLSVNSPYSLASGTAKEFITTTSGTIFVK